MTQNEFCYWLQGYTELTNSTPSPEQWKVIKEHLQLVFTKITPPMGLPYSPSLLSKEFITRSSPLISYC